MKTKLFISLFIFLLYAFNSSTISLDFSGNWHSETASSIYDLRLTQANNKVYGSHCSVQLNGDKIDCVLDDTDVSLSGNIENSTYVIVTFTSQISLKTGTAKITKINDTTIEWKIITKPQGEYHIPNQINLTKQ